MWFHSPVPVSEWLVKFFSCSWNASLHQIPSLCFLIQIASPRSQYGKYETMLWPKTRFSKHVGRWGWLQQDVNVSWSSTLSQLICLSSTQQLQIWPSRWSRRLFTHPAFPDSRASVCLAQAGPVVTVWPPGLVSSRTFVSSVFLAGILRSVSDCGCAVEQVRGLHFMELFCWEQLLVVLKVMRAWH